MPDTSLSTSTNLIHSPSAGLIDIKPLDTSYLAYWKDLASIILFLIACALFFYLILPLLRKKDSSADAASLLSPIEEFQTSFNKLNTPEIPIREFSESLSSALRQYIDRSLTLTTKTTTPKEALRQFEPRLKQILPLLPKKNRNELEDILYKILCLLEESAYADHAQIFNRNDWKSDALTTSREWVKTLQSELDREAKRTQAVTEENNSSHPQDEGRS